MVLASLSIRSVGSLSGLDSRASVGQWPNWVSRRSVCAWARYPLSVSLCVTPSVGKIGSSPMACRMVLLGIPSIVVSCRSLSTPRCVAWYFDLSSCLTTRVLYVGLSFRLVRALASLRTSLVMCMKWSLKSSIGLM